MSGLNARWVLCSGVLVGCVAGCAEVLSLPSPPAEDGVLLTNWNSEPAFAWFPPFDGIGEAQNRGDVHWLVPDFDPLRVPEPRAVQLSLTEGIPLSGKQTYMLNGGAEPSWVLATRFDDTRYRYPGSEGDLALCQALSACVSAGSCNKDCVDTGVESPARPAEGCPVDWTNTSTNGGWFCVPDVWVTAPVERPQMDCGEGRTDFGEGCVDLGPCAVGFPEASSATAAVYLDAMALAGGDGSFERPFNQWSELADVPGLGREIVIAAGDYTWAEMTDLTGYAAIRGVCASRVRLQGGLRTGTDLTIEGIALEGELFVLASRTQIFRSEIRGLVRSLLVRSSATVVADRSLFSVGSVTATAGYSVRVAGLFEGTEVRIDYRGLVDAGARLKLERSVVVALEDEPAQAASNLRVDHAQLELRDSVVYALNLVGISGTGSDIVAMKSRILSRERAGISLVESTNLELTEVAVFSDRNPERPEIEDHIPAIHSERGLSARLRDVVTSGNRRGIELIDALPQSMVNLDRVWLGSTGDRSFAESGGGQVILQDAWLRAEAPAVMPPLSVNNAQLAIDGRATVNRVNLLTRGRNALAFRDRSQPIVNDVEIVDPHGRTFFVARGAEGEVNRVLAPGSAGITLEIEPNSVRSARVIASSLDITFDASRTRRRLESDTFLISGGVMTWDGFVARGTYLSTGRSFGAGGGLIMRNGSLELPELREFNPDLFSTLTNVRLRLSPISPTP